MLKKERGTADLTWGQVNEVLGIVQKALPKAFAGIPYKEFCEVKGDVLEPILHQAFLDAIDQGALGLPTYPITVNYDLTVEEMVAAGRYDHVNSDLIKILCPVQGKGKQKKEITLFHFDEHISSDEAIRRMDKEGYQPAEQEDNLALGADHPDLQREFPVIALGSRRQHPVHGDRYVVCLWGNAGNRNVNLNLFDNDWNPNYRFAAVRKCLYSSASQGGSFLY